MLIMQKKMAITALSITANLILLGRNNSIKSIPRISIILFPTDDVYHFSQKLTQFSKNLKNVEVYERERSAQGKYPQ